MERGFEKDLMLDWDLDLDVLRRHTDRAITHGRKPPKLVQNLIFSMPKGTPSDKLAAAVRAFAVNQFALKHRYAMALHTHQGNPHIHLVVRAISEQGVRLNIRKATLRDWRQQFAAHLREQGIAANATERAVRRSVNCKIGWRFSLRKARLVHLRRGEAQFVCFSRPQSTGAGSGDPRRQPVAKWSKAGIPFTMRSNATDTRKSLGTSDGYWHKCFHPALNANKSPWTSWPPRSETQSLSASDSVAYGWVAAFLRRLRRGPAQSSLA